MVHARDERQRGKGRGRDGGDGHREEMFNSQRDKGTRNRGKDVKRRK